MAFSSDPARLPLLKRDSLSPLRIRRQSSTGSEGDEERGELVLVMPHFSPVDRLRQFFSRGKILFLLGLALLQCLMLATVPPSAYVRPECTACGLPPAPHPCDPKLCHGHIPLWQPHLTMVTIFLAVMLIADSWPTDLVLLGASLTLRLAGIINDDELWSGFSNPGVMGLAALLVVSQGIYSTGVLEVFFYKFRWDTERGIL